MEYEGYKNDVTTPGCKEAIENVNGFQVRREVKHIMEAKTVLTPLISAVGDKILLFEPSTYDIIFWLKMQSAQ